MTDTNAQPSPDSPLIPKPTFDVLPLTAEVKRALGEMGYETPTPVQIAAYEPVVRGKDVIVQARTGTGKTTAFGLPLVDQVVRKSGALQSLILCPTRELALQVAAEITKLGQYRGIKVSAVYGGAPMGRQIAELEDGAHIVVGTPGRVLDHLRRGTMEPKGIRTLVLDEADEMLSMGFEKELQSIVEKLPKSRQTLLFSATLSDDVGRLVRDMREPERILLSGDQVGALELKHYFYLQQGDKIRDLLRILEVENPQSAILFCNTKDETERVAREVRRAGYPAEYISGDLDQKERERVMAALREGKVRYLAATDVASRGIDISHLTHVINVDFPDNPEAYVHRTGRTGRAGRTGTAISLLSAKSVGNLYYLRLTYGLRPIERSLPTEQELATRRELDLVGKVESLLSTAPPSAAARALARRILVHDDPEGLVGTLLRAFLGAELPAEEAAKARRALTVKVEELQPVKEQKPTPKLKHLVSGEVLPVRETRVELRQESPVSSSVSTVRIHPGRSAVEPDANRSTPIDEPPSTPILAPVTSTLEIRERAVRSAEDRPRRSRERHRPAHAELSGWSPKEEDDDETPIFRREPLPPEPVQPSREQGEQTATMFINVGKRDGVRTADLVKCLEGRGIASASIIRVRLRDRNSFVDVPAVLIQRAIELIEGGALGGRVLHAEVARSRENEGDSVG